MKKLKEKLSKLLRSEITRSGHVEYDLTAEALFNRYDSHANAFFTLIVEQDFIKKEAFEDTKFVSSKYETKIPAIRKEALKILNRKFNYRFEWVYDTIDQYYPEKETQRKKWYKEFENYFRCLIESCYPRALENLLQEWAFEKFEGREENYNEQEYIHITNKNHKEFEEYRKSIFMPVYLKKYDLNFENILPETLGQFSHSCNIKQFYFIKNERELLVSCGCDCGSWTRYQHGILGHYFALLENRGIKIKTYIGKINFKCQFKVYKESENLILYDRGYE